ncbi:hypothetical protein Tdes44962_MAKER04976 [Teratosphaeria destructans]|uniref:Uncharacterized protein n=1 Tax=Teratosphaeria destructans TaxID=418781 RepID=A0A9W7VZP1_9PEZI|nr:hypothetical protein Tdes44962_MAKER04976 [Teratosphaeria destructans]
MGLPQLLKTSAPGDRTPRTRKTKISSPSRPWTHTASATPQLTGSPASNVAHASPTSPSSPAPPPHNPATAIEPVISNPMPLRVLRTSGSTPHLESEPNLPTYLHRAAPPPYIPGTYGGLGTTDPNQAEESPDHPPPYRSTETLELPAYSPGIVVAPGSPRMVADVRRWYGRPAGPRALEEGDAYGGLRDRGDDADVVRCLKLKGRWRWSLFALGVLLLVFIAVGSLVAAFTLARGGF